MGKVAKLPLLLAAALCCSCAKKTAEDPEGLRIARELVDKATHGKAKAVNAYHLSQSLDSVVIESGGKKSIAWVLTDRKQLMIGSLYDASGRDISSRTEDFIPVDEAVMLQRASQAYGFTEGVKGPLFYVFFDPNCSVCSRFFRETRSFIASGSLRIHWIPVAFLKPDSAGKAEAILSASDPVAALVRHEAAFDEKTEKGGINPLAGQRPDMHERVVANTELLTKGNDQAGTPAILYMRTDGKAALQIGMPRDIAKMIDSAKD